MDPLPLEFEVRIPKFPVQDERMSKVFIFTPSRDAKRIYRNKSTTMKRIISRQDISTNFWGMKRVWSLLTDKTGCISPDNSGGNREAPRAHRGWKCFKLRLLVQDSTYYMTAPVASPAFSPVSSPSSLARQPSSAPTSKTKGGPAQRE